MKKANIFMAVAAAVVFSTSAVHADEVGTEDCKVVDPKTGKGLIKAFKNSCKTTCKTEADRTDCANKAKEGDADAFILVPSGQCAKINAGDFSGVSPEIKALINEPSK